MLFSSGNLRDVLVWKPSLFPIFPEQLPENDQNLKRGADDEQKRQVWQPQRQIQTHAERPDQNRDRNALLPDAPPEAGKDNADDGGDRHGKHEEKPRAEGDLRDEEGAEQRGGDHENQRDRQQQDEHVIRRLGLLRRLDLADEVADGDAVEIGNLRQDENVGQAFSGIT